MKIKVFTILMVLVTMSSVFSQSNLNNYKYVIIPKRYDFLKQENQYRLNELTKFLFDKYGFVTLTEGEGYPEDLAKNRCLALKSDVISDSGLFKTKLFTELKNCNDQIVFTSEIGESKEKEYEKAYSEALRNAFKSFEGLAYKYEPIANEDYNKQETVKVSDEAAQEIQKLKEEIETLKQDKVEEVVPETTIQVETIGTLNKETPKVESVKEVVSSNGTLYAQPIENGFQLVDSSPKVVYKIKSSGLDSVFFVEDKQAILYKKGDNWIFEYYESNILKQDMLNIKF